MQEDRIRPSTARSLDQSDYIQNQYKSTSLALRPPIKFPTIKAKWIKNSLIVVVLIIVGVCGYFFRRGMLGKSELVQDEVSNKKKEEIVGYYSQDLNNKLIEFYKKQKANEVLDLQCGRCYYAKNIKAAGIRIQAYDGNPYSEQLTEGFVKFLDSSILQDLLTTYDWVQSLEIQNHMTQVQLKTFFENIVRHAKMGIIVSWSAQRQARLPEDSIQINKNFIELVRPHQFVYDQKTTMEFRNLPNMEGLRNSLMVFRATGF